MSINNFSKTTNTAVQTSSIIAGSSSYGLDLTKLRISKGYAYVPITGATALAGAATRVVYDSITDAPISLAPQEAVVSLSCNAPLLTGSAGLFNFYLSTATGSNSNTQRPLLHTDVTGTLLAYGLASSCPVNCLYTNAGPNYLVLSAYSTATSTGVVNVSVLTLSS